MAVAVAVVEVEAAVAAAVWLPSMSATTTRRRRRTTTTRKRMRMARRCGRRNRVAASSLTFTPSRGVHACVSTLGSQPARPSCSLLTSESVRSYLYSGRPLRPVPRLLSRIQRTLRSVSVSAGILPERRRGGERRQRALPTCLHCPVSQWARFPPRRYSRRLLALPAARGGGGLPPCASSRSNGQVVAALRHLPRSRGVASRLGLPSLSRRERCARARVQRRGEGGGQHWGCLNLDPHVTAECKPWTSCASACQRLVRMLSLRMLSLRCSCPLPALAALTSPLP